MATKILFPAGKGGAGKSTYLRLLISWLQEAGIEPYLIDTDENMTLCRFFPQAKKIDVRRSKSLDHIVDIAETGAHPLIIVDSKAGAGFDVKNFFETVPFEELEEIGVNFVVHGLLSSCPDSARILFRWIDFLGNRVQYVVVKNLKDSDASMLDEKTVSFPAYDLTRPGIEFAAKFKPAEILMRGLDPEYQSELERCSLTIRDVLARRPDVPDLLKPLMVRSKLRNYQGHLYEQFEAHKEILLP
jgi:hypothetical protein